MQKPALIFGIFSLILIAVFFYWQSTPNSQDQRKHQAIFCNVIRQPNTVLQSDVLSESFAFYFNNSTPMYAYHKPKFYQNYAHKLVERYLKESPQNQLKAQQSFDQCMLILEKD
ncbi:hypothetical protein RFI36_01300 [Acinetobacter gerneri]|uniref:DUF2388 domain-containing protein n=1 Tax=Acinetobacter gerneri TaxID=202952 RepID=A0AAW8JF09_9GAMM|nr:hypothetical protein [Acinetobacter gerneri]MDQ9008549.1 hypothetical protein [Acinetobacter gerneri]MDQ9012486.1 hypothetical protein [Acinetobacter gerneri]MDQ9023921.1 hypothetical protein [Acinetobacter gerneri]MDQ9051117.1 hypothetical protein [Acinetobacter gerneri]MDQ9058381.1 hypothetical protein [Acinetobacter gerneri]